MISSVVKWAKLTGIGVLLLVCVAFVCVLLLLKTSWVYDKIENEVLAASGYELSLPDRASVSSVYPQAGASVPSAVIRSTDPESPLQRLRLNDVSVSLPFRHLKENPLNELVVRVGAVTAILQTGADDTRPATDRAVADLPVVDVENLLAELMSTIAGTNMAVSVGELSVITRGINGTSSTYRSNANQILLTSENLQVSGTVLMPESEQSFLLQHRFVDAPEEGISSSFTLDVTSNAQPPVLYTVASQQTIRGTEIDIDEFSVTGPELNASGFLVVALDERYRLGGAVDIRQLELSDVTSAINAQGTTSDTDPDTVVLFSDQVVDPGQYADIDLAVSFGAVRFNNQPVVSGDVQISGDRERVSVQSSQLLLLGGPADINVDATAADEGYQMSVRADIDGAQLSRLQITQDEKLLFSSGDADMKVSMRAAGKTQKDLARSLAGYFMFASSDVELSQRYAEQLDRGIVSFVLKSIDGFRKDDAPALPDHMDSSLPLSCASLKLVVNEGRLEVTNGLIVDLPDNVLISSGFIDLHSETLGFAFRTKKKKLFDWSALSLVKFVELGGRLAEPRLSLDRKALLKQGLLTSSSVLVGALPPLVYRLADAGLRSGESVECTPELY